MQTLKSKFNIGTILLFLFMLFGTGYGSFIGIQFFIENSSSLELKSWIGFVFCICLFLLILFIIISKTKTIEFDNDKIIVKYLFRFKTFIYKYDDIEGYRWDYISMGQLVDCKLIKIKAKSEKIFNLTDYEYSNFREIEKISKNRLNLKISEKWITPDKERKEIEISQNTKFDIDQAKDIRIFVCILGLICITLISYILYDMIDKSKYTLNGFVFLLILYLGLYLLIKKFLKTNKFITEIKNKT